MSTMRKRPSKLETPLGLEAVEGRVRKTVREQRKLRKHRRDRGSDSACVFSLIGGVDYEGLQLLSNQLSQVMSRTQGRLWVTVYFGEPATPHEPGGSCPDAEPANTNA
eukprot:9915766-Alexandrium_andersonii.AAC.1